MFDSTRFLAGVLGITAVYYIDAKDEKSLFYVRVAFGVASILNLLGCLIIFFMVMCQSKLKERKCTITLPNKQSVTKTFREYDMAKLGNLVLKVVVGGVIGAFLHYKNGLLPPLVMNLFVMPFTVFNNELAWVHLYRQPDKNELKRPWELNEPSFSPLELWKELKQEMREFSGGNKRKRNKRGVNLQAIRKTTKRH